MSILVQVSENMNKLYKINYYFFYNLYTLQLIFLFLKVLKYSSAFGLFLEITMKELYENSKY